MPSQSPSTEIDGSRVGRSNSVTDAESSRQLEDVLSNLESVSRLLGFVEQSTDSEAAAKALSIAEARLLPQLDIVPQLKIVPRQPATRRTLPPPAPVETPIPEHPAVSVVPRFETVATTACLACGSEVATRRFAIQGVSEQLVECDGCRLGTLFPMPDAERIASFYPTEYYGTPDAKFEPLVEFGVRLGASLRVRSLVSGIPAGGRVLDIGCGRGVMLRALLDLGYEAHGVEISADAAAGADPRAKIAIAPALADADYATDSFDAVILWHVLEHLPQPDETLAEIRRILKRGGRLIIAVPNFASWQSRATGPNWFHLDLPRHLYHFTPESLKQLLHGHGFASYSTRHLALLQNPFGWLQSSLNALLNVPRNSLYTLLHRSEDEATRQPLTRRQRVVLRCAYWLGLPLAGAVSVVEALFRRGGTIAVTARLQ
jgi:2-polyprenyl-3-methyl-5-hydroxy-6-metoxy-1,4-benzoquinol methylase